MIRKTNELRAPLSVPKHGKTPLESAKTGQKQPILTTDRDSNTYLMYDEPHLGG